jgi:hypothetical protein
MLPYLGPEFVALIAKWDSNVERSLDDDCALHSDQSSEDAPDVSHRRLGLIDSNPFVIRVQRIIRWFSHTVARCRCFVGLNRLSNKGKRATDLLRE